MTMGALLSLPRRELERLLRHGHPIDDHALDDSEYFGTSLGLPALVERLTWKHFRKAFHRDPTTGALRGWNVRLEQHTRPARPKLRAGLPRTFGHYRVVQASGRRLPPGCDRGLLLDYGWLRDPLVSLRAGSVDLLLGWSYLDLGFATLGTPSFFVLEREGKLSHVAESRADTIRAITR